MGKKRLPRLDKERVQYAMKKRGFVRVKDGKIEYLYLELARRVFHPRYPKNPNAKKAIDRSLSTKMHRLLLPADNRESIGVQPDTLSCFADVLGTLPGYLIGTELFMSDEQREAHQERLDEAAGRISAQELHDFAQEYRKSPVYALVKDHLHGIMFFSDKGDGPLIEVSLKSDPGIFHTLTPATLRMIESACLDLCCSLIRHGSERDRILTTLED